MAEIQLDLDPPCATIQWYKNLIFDNFIICLLLPDHGSIYIPSSFVRHPRYLIHRRYLYDDTSIDKVTIYHDISYDSKNTVRLRKYREYRRYRHFKTFHFRHYMDK